MDNGHSIIVLEEYSKYYNGRNLKYFKCKCHCGVIFHIVRHKFKNRKYCSIKCRNVSICSRNKKEDVILLIKILILAPRIKPNMKLTLL